MAKLLLYTDPHFCTYSSVLRGRGKKYSFRIENLITTFNWINKVAEENKVDDIYCLGDLFDKPDLTAEEITALREVSISNHQFLIGNHESFSNDLYFNSVNIFKANIFSEPILRLYGNTQIVFLPYIGESDRKSITSTLDDLNVNNDKKIVIFSHNDIKNIYYGKFLTTIGYDKEDIEANCDLFINGHIHNGAWISRKILNLGSVTGINFNNDASSWKPQIAILDTDTLQLTQIENPYAVLFYKEEFKSASEAIKFIDKVAAESNEHPIVISIKCFDKDHDVIEEELLKHDFIYKRVLIDYTKEATTNVLDKECELSISIDYFEKFRTFVKDRYGAEDINCKLMLEEINTIATVGGIK